MKATKTKLKEILRNHQSSIRVTFDEEIFEPGAIITSNRLTGNQYYISNKQDHIYDIRNIDGSNNIHDLRVGTSFEIVPLPPIPGSADMSRLEPLRNKK